jgi:peptidoglycan/LPS O-acetylase OafA/YrhL
LITMFSVMMLLRLFAKFWSYKTANPFWYALIESMPFEAMAIGGSGAWLYKQHPEFVLKLIKMKFLQVVVTGIIMLILIDQLKILNPFSHIITGLITVIVIYYAHLFEKPYIDLKNKYINYLGKISYGIYVYHPLVIGLVAILIKGLAIPTLLSIPLFFVTVILLTILIAYISYNYFEKYFLKIKSKYAVIRNKD